MTARAQEIDHLIATAPTDPAPPVEPYHRCPCCAVVYAAESHWLACPLPRGGEYQHGGDCLLRLRLCGACGTSMAREVADPYQATIDAADEAQAMSAGYAALEERCAELDGMLRAESTRADALQVRIRQAYAHLGTAQAMLIDTDEPALAEHIRAAAKILMGGGA